MTGEQSGLSELIDRRSFITGLAVVAVAAIVGLGIRLAAHASTAVVLVSACAVLLLSLVAGLLLVSHRLREVEQRLSARMDERVADIEAKLKKTEANLTLLGESTSQISKFVGQALDASTLAQAFVVPSWLQSALDYARKQGWKVTATSRRIVLWHPDKNDGQRYQVPLPLDAATEDAVRDNVRALVGWKSPLMAYGGGKSMTPAEASILSPRRLDQPIHDEGGQGSMSDTT